MEDPNLADARDAGKRHSSQSPEPKDSSGRPHCGQPISGAITSDTPVGASEDDAGSYGRDAMAPKSVSAEASDGDSDIGFANWRLSYENAVEPVRFSQLRTRLLKRKMQEELYDPISKKMKPASQVSLEMSSFSTEVAGRYMSVVHNEVFRVAGRSGLINPADFDVGSDGVVGLSKHALKKVYPDDKS
ncbi:hypothetical protein FDENT_14051 [Fusarium denticulatum]|uniref:Uncharacterized protein n=1 Tax=Fusarium denticulatum TaxID=48507 RepID=A0A8H5SX50_9HYPO|nr:hypothetical protein FDENT_14051 [Fusarium denticulatum]